MSTSETGVFYAYARNTTDDINWRYIITFTNRAAADVWYRLVTDSVAAGRPRFKSVLRLGLQYFTFNASEALITETITDANVAFSVRTTLFFTVINNSNLNSERVLSVIPTLNYPLNLSGNRFFIRSSLDDTTYWYYDPANELVYASRTRRTKFIITIADPDKAFGTTMIDSDDVHLSIGPGNNIGVVNINQLGFSDNPSPFKFSSLSTDFQVDYTSGDTRPSSDIISRNTGQGESWELV